MNLNTMVKQGVSSIMKTAGRHYLNNKRGRKFLTETLPYIKRSADLREKNESEGTHVPVFLIASVASQCNLHCKGCYARSTGSCSDADIAEDLSKDEWDHLFEEASELGVSFILIAGGEPLMRQDVIEVAGNHAEIIFPIFTNGTMLDEDYLSLFDEKRNLIPIISIEGDVVETDTRRGSGTYEKIASAMGELSARNILFGTSITVTRENMDVVTTQEFLDDLQGKGCGVAIYVEYVPTEVNTEYLALTEDDLVIFEKNMSNLRVKNKNMVILSFPGDEEAMGGCLASGRGFFHVNPKGGAEPCPFSPYAKHNVKNASLKTVLCSDYFRDLREIAAKAGPHTGGCTLFTHEEEVQLLYAQ